MNLSIISQAFQCSIICNFMHFHSANAVSSVILCTFIQLCWSSYMSVSLPHKPCLKAEIQCQFFILTNTGVWIPISALLSARAQLHRCPHLQECICMFRSPSVSRSVKSIFVIMSILIHSSKSVGCLYIWNHSKFDLQEQFLHWPFIPKQFQDCKSLFVCRLL